MLSFPIPDKHTKTTYRDIKHNGASIGPMVERLTKGRIPQSYKAHLDPDLVRERLRRKQGWRPLFGQTNQAQVHLANNGVREDDLFLFFGLFRRTVTVNGVLAWDREARPIHVIWGWMQVGEVYALSSRDSLPYTWAQDHPHLQRKDDPHNTVYTGRRTLDLGRRTSDAFPGAGVFPSYSPALQLTAEPAGRLTEWQLPRWFYPLKGQTPLTYHAKRDRWKLGKDHVRLQAAARGQEFVLDCDEYPDAAGWLTQLISDEVRH